MFESELFLFDMAKLLSASDIFVKELGLDLGQMPSFHASQWASKQGPPTRQNSILSNS